ncbi:MAG TPA: 16S rRNA (adenine(1518)-N(6)/adenine(1519)-N(6))-dimethyltransferase RsmA [Candidatus Thiothrix moscowensis]|mgnify:CR=1 FL=1|uniref:16S rRNA (adenine(1518)-N(6)/adenine(1519)-N(6))- dimethyltransferase RsmA n=1 Tax=unclassified Thiothrix TaxID=2636184 RepID=UPI001A3442DF|nr:MULTISPECIES: 16S rRNA (adenine(1518)-N(6)/adenine(1519)-N(6))-dimethyltransferase RsmA [unclassified Thiothrix]MBJ6611886.1 16S rRNA (adenine(1518)-N(6)/adenine(1519)-N(6))-dimethyltransferase RsmA [Candidatus Thiothrix moscowensis]HRJ51287.1 16S rRNA (adenine(1518)-N(6)/adenine(1519)-N(6))-dimethyltransferase RsmA [Candidatus Thiothrix moscowensis]HRJ91658.1 16S rRNA (adenine(1518)-N(6)/adenine(1519)-N(6))-dimethyltransferase RsmA [Candidatus Thiothrix moscowensis]
MPRYEHQAKKRFGQHFLHDRNVIDKMLRAINLQTTDRVVEIGPGPGALTFPLLEILPRLDVVEIDRDVIAWWQQQPQAQGKLHIHAQDALKLDIPGLRGEGDRLRIVGNLPYNISTPLIFHFLRHRQHIRDMLFMLQKEVVDRITAEPDSSDYSRLSVMVQYYCDTHYLLKIGPGAFSPPPKVDSAVVYLQPWATPPHVANDPEHFADLVAQAFSQRRKTLRNTLKGMVTAEQMESVGIDPQRRAETLTVADFVNLANL